MKVEPQKIAKIPLEKQDETAGANKHHSLSNTANVKLEK